MLDQNSIVVRSAQQVSVDLDDKTVILNTQSGIYYGLDDVGARVWHLVAGMLPRLYSLNTSSTNKAASARVDSSETGFLRMR